MSKRSAVVIGAGIVGLAIARALAKRNYQVTVIERNDPSVGASIRNFGMVWPIGQPPGALYDRALLSKQIWKETCDDANIWYEEKGSLHLAYQRDELQVLEELVESYRSRGYQLLDPAAATRISTAVVQSDLAGALFSRDEMVVDAKKAIGQLAAWLSEKFAVRFIRGKTVTAINYPSVIAGKEVFGANEIFICNGADFETLYPDEFAGEQITKCKLQMIRLQVQPNGWRIGPSLCGALSLLHYPGFKAARTLPALRVRLEAEYPEYKKWGIHVMVSQNQAGELTVGDSHQYGLAHDPFDNYHVNTLILDYLQQFAMFPDPVITETWNGIYSKMTNGASHLVMSPEQGVTVVNGLGGAGMTLSFGLCEQLVAGSLVD